MKCLLAGFLALVAIAGGGLWLDSWVAPSAKVPCDPAFAETLDADLAAVGRPAGVAAPGPSDFGGGHCEDGDGGGVSLSLVSYRSDLPVVDVVGYYETALGEHGWSGVTTRGSRFSRAPAVCAWRAVAGHRVEFWVGVQGGSKVGDYAVSVVGDAGRPRC